MNKLITKFVNIMEAGYFVGPMLLLILLSSFLLVGCMVEGGGNKATEVTPFTPHPFITEYKATEVCTILTAPYPNVAVIEDKYWPFNSKHQGYYDEFSQIVFIKGNHLYLLRHEFVHYLLHINTGNLDPSHTSYLFDICGVG